MWEQLPIAQRELADESPNGAWMRWVLEHQAGGPHRDVNEVLSLWPQDELTSNQVENVKKIGAEAACSLFVSGLYWRYHFFRRAVEAVRPHALMKGAALEVRLTYADGLAMMGSMKPHLTRIDRYNWTMLSLPTS